MADNEIEEFLGEEEEEEDEEVDEVTEDIKQKKIQDEEKAEEVEEEEEEEDPRERLTKDQVHTYKELYTYLDDQGKNKLPNKHLGTALRLLGINPRQIQLRRLIDRYDKEFKGWVDFKTFLLPVCWTMNWLPDTMEEVIAAFKVLDPQDTGVVINQELIEFMTTMGEVLEDFEIDSLIKWGDKKRQGFIRYEDFVTNLMAPPKKKKGKGKKGKKK